MTSKKMPKHLWSGDWREEAEAQRALRSDAPTAVEEQPAVPAPATPDPSRRRRRPLVLAGAGIAVMVAGAFAAGTLTGGEDLRPTSAVLPAVQSSPITAPAGQSRAGAIYAAASPAVVSIRAGQASGTGFLIDDEGTIVTNAHVVDNASSATVHFGEDGDDIPAEVVGTDPSSDLAVVRIDAARIPADTEPLQLADSDQVAVGDGVVAIGNPFGLDRTLTEGIVSGVGRDIQAPNGFSISEAIQTDAAINPGNSGGPLLDDGGKVIGVNSQIETAGASSGNVGVGFAVSSNTVRRVVPILQDGRSVQRAWLGVSMADAPGGGARVEETVTGSPAAAAGLRAGDVILAVGDEEVADGSALGAIVEAQAPGDEVTLHVRRDGRDVAVDVTLRNRPSEAP